MAKIYHFNVHRIALFCVLFISGIPLLAQSRTVRKAEKNKEKIDRQEERTYEKSRKEAIKAHYDRQSESTKKQMKQSRKESKAFEKGKKEGIFETVKRRSNYNQERKHRSKRQKR